MGVDRRAHHDNVGGLGSVIGQVGPEVGVPPRERYRADSDTDPCRGRVIQRERDVIDGVRVHESEQA